MTKVALQRVLVCTQTYTNFASSQAVHKSLALKQQIPRWTARPSRKCQFKQRKIVIEGMVLSTVDGICPRCHSSWVRMANGMSALSEVTTVNLRLFSTNTRNERCPCFGNDWDFCKAEICFSLFYQPHRRQCRILKAVERIC